MINRQINWSIEKITLRPIGDNAQSVDDFQDDLKNHAREDWERLTKDKDKEKVCKCIFMKKEMKEMEERVRMLKELVSILLEDRDQQEIHLGKWDNKNNKVKATMKKDIKQYIKTLKDMGMRFERYNESQL